MSVATKLSIAAAAPLLLAAAAPTAQDRADARCLVVALLLASNTDKEVSNSGILVSQYYLGRIDGRSPAADLEKLIEAEATSMDDAQAKVLLKRCGAEVENRGKEIVAIGQRLEKKGI